MDKAKVEPVWEGLHSLTLLYFPDFIAFFFFFSLGRRYQKTGVSHQTVRYIRSVLPRILNVPHWQFPCGDMRGKNIFSSACKIWLRSTISSVLSYPTPWAQLLWFKQASAETCKDRGRKRPFAPSKCTARAELLWLQLTFQIIWLIAVFWTVHECSLWHQEVLNIWIPSII